jgi:chromate transporter
LSGIIHTVKVPLKQLFSAFLSIGLTAFGGGGTAQIYQAIVVRRGWLDEREFLETSALCRILPGPVFANLAAHMGTRLGGVLGGVVALLGVLTPGALLMLLLTYAYVRFGALPGSAAESVLNGVAAAAIGIILASMIRQAPLALDSVKAMALALVVFVTYGLLRWPLLLVLLLTVPVGMVLYWKESAWKEKEEGGRRKEES